MIYHSVGNGFAVYKSFQKDLNTSGLS